MILDPNDYYFTQDFTHRVPLTFISNDFLYQAHKIQ